MKEEGEGSGCRVQGSRKLGIRNEELGIRNEGGGFAEILRLRSQLFWHSLSHIRRFSPLRMTIRCAKRCQNSAALLIFMRRTTIPNFSFLIPHSCKAFIHNQWTEPPKELTLTPNSIFPARIPSGALSCRIFAGYCPWLWRHGRASPLCLRRAKGWTEARQDSTR